jgi:diadenosine tetraphosphate (Ap4A) HIT family hydrolase
MTYDTNNIFAKILRGEIPCNKVYEDEFALAFHDIAPAAPLHILVIPKGQFVSFSDFSLHASAQMLQGYFAAIQKIAAQQNLTDFRLITNNGAGAGQTVHHFHMHLLAGKRMDGLLP